MQDEGELQGVVLNLPVKLSTMMTSSLSSAGLAASQFQCQVGINDKQAAYLFDSRGDAAALLDVEGGLFAAAEEFGQAIEPIDILGMVLLGWTGSPSWGGICESTIERTILSNSSTDNSPTVR